MGTKTFFTLIRHGHYKQPEGVPSAYLPYDLTNDGKEQAAKAARILLEFAKKNDLKIHYRIYSSVLLRAWRTAQLIAQNLSEELGESFEVNETEKLCERSVGSLANLTVAEIEEIIDKDPRIENPPEGWKSNSNYKLPYPGAESLLDSGIRVLEFVEEALGRLEELERPKALTIFVGHGASIRHAAHKMHLLSLEDIKKLSMHYCSPVYFSQEKKTDGFKYQHFAGEWKIRSKNESARD